MLILKAWLLTGTSRLITLWRSALLVPVVPSESLATNIANYYKNKIICYIIIPIQVGYF